MSIDSYPGLKFRFFVTDAMVSIIIPYIDEYVYLAEAMASAQGQLDVDIELIVVCNAPSLPDEYSPLPDHLKDAKFIHQPLAGSANARNAGLKVAQGEWIQFLDVDDLLYPQKISHQLPMDNADVIVSPHIYKYLNSQTENSKWMPDDIWIGLLNSGLGSTSSMLWKREALLEVGGWNTTYQSHQEYELLFRLAAGKKIVPNDHCETIVRQRKSGSITVTSKPVRLEEGIRLRESMWVHLVTNQLETPERYDAFRQYIFRSLRGLMRQDKKKATGMYEKYFSGQSFSPKEIAVPGYTFLYQVFGFYKTEHLLQNFVSLRNRVQKKNLNQLYV